MSRKVDTWFCDNCRYVVVAPIGRKFKRCVACDGAGRMILDNETSLGDLLDRMEEHSYRRSYVDPVED